MWTFLGFTISMLVGSYLAGSIPLACNFSEAKLKQVSILGAGLLVGTVLTVIIPEGVHAMYSEMLHPSSHSSSVAHVGAPAVINDHAHHEHPPIRAHHSPDGAVVGPAAQAPGAAAMRKIAEISSVVKGGVETGAAALPNPAAEVVKGHSEHEDDVHQIIGLVLLLGFIFMLVIDQMSGHSRSPEKNITATLGLVVHSAADGIALGAASSTSHLRVEMIVFFAIMLHKGPAAFGLVTILLRDGADRNRIRKHLLIFSLAAPVLAVITYFGLSQRSKDNLDTMNATGIAMLFSAGTFLYVATVHVLPELEAKNNHCSSTSSLPGGAPSDDHRRGFSRFDIIILLIGSCLPLLLSLGHSHHH